jgi:hypothetical protein
MGRQKGQKTTTLVKQQRLNEMMDLLGQGKYRYEIMTFLMTKWAMTERGVQHYYNAALKIIKDGFSDEILLQRYNHIFAKTLEESPAVALKAVDSIAKLKLGGFKNNETIININRPED